MNAHPPARLTVRSTASKLESSLDDILEMLETLNSQHVRIQLGELDDILEMLEIQFRKSIRFLEILESSLSKIVSESGMAKHPAIERWDAGSGRRAALRQYRRG